MNAPNCYVIAGPNGAGKTTFAYQYLPVYARCENFINPDFLAKGFSPLNPDAGLLRAGMAMAKLFNEFSTARKDFAFETTLSGMSYLGKLEHLKKNGYRIHLFYLWIPDAEMSLLRVRQRVEEGGHNVPEKAIRRRYPRSLANLFNRFRPLCDSLRFFDNSITEPRLVFSEFDGDVKVGDAVLYNSLLREVKHED